MKREDIIDRLNTVFSGTNYKYDLIVDSNMNDTVEVICEKHGMFKKRLNRLLNGSGCPKCSGKVKKTTEEFIKEANEVHNGKYEYCGEYVNSHTKMRIICQEHGEFYQTPTNHLNGCGCPKCKVEKLKKEFSSNTDDFIRKANIVHKGLYSYDKCDYVNNSTPVLITCSKHGDFYQLPHNHLQGKGCPICNESKLEKKIREVLNEKGVEYISQWRLPWNRYYSLDFYLPKYNIGIECQGIQHYEPRDKFGGEEEFKKTVERDEYKKKSCAENGINVLYFNKNDNVEIFIGNCNLKL